MTFHRLFNIILLLALIPTIAVSGILTYSPTNSSLVTGFTGLEVLGTTYDGDFVYDSFIDIGGKDPATAFPFFLNYYLAGNFSVATIDLLNANSMPQLVDGSTVSNFFFVPYWQSTSVVFVDGGALSTSWNRSSTQIGLANDRFYLTATESVAEESSSAVPEPSSMVLILCCITALIIGRKRFTGQVNSLAANA